MNTELTRPALRYHGGKWRLAPWIISNFPAHRTFVEPFGGGASVLLRKARAYAEIYNDIDEELVNLFRVLRNREQAAELDRMVRLTPFARVEHREAYEPCDEPVEMARRTLIKSGMGFGSNGSSTYTGFRTNARRAGTIPAHDWASYPNNISALVERLQGVIIENRPAEQVITTFDGLDTLHYVDPPYVHSTRGGHVRYRYELDEAQHRALASVLHGAKGMVVLSGYPCALYDDELYADWIRVERRTHADDHGERTEVLWLSPNCEQQTQLTLENTR